LDANSFFYLAKLAWLVLAPSHLVLWLAVAAAISLAAGRVRLAQGLAVATALVLIGFGVLPTGDMLARALENQYPRPATPPAHIDGVVSLGGGLETGILLERQAPGWATSETRLVSTFELARRYPTARVVFTGGWGFDADAKAAKYIFDQMGLEPSRLTLEPNARDTYENLLYSQRLVQPKPGEVWVLATSAIQMPRAMAVARRLGWRMTPWPTDYLTTPRLALRPLGDYLDVVRNLGTADQALHEWVGLAAYRVNGMTRAKAAA
jgi:uncharacterized SAM-binding protein YcdF (DUF218 family)